MINVLPITYFYPYHIEFSVYIWTTKKNYLFLLTYLKQQPYFNTKIIYISIFNLIKTTNIMRDSKKSFSALLQALCSAILFISCLLPWLNLTSPNESLKGQFNLINMPVQIVSEAGITNAFPPSGTIFDYDKILFYVILFFVLANIFIQLIKRNSFFTCYSCLFPTFFSYLFWARVADCGNLECAGIGLYLANIFGTIAIIIAWTDLGKNDQTHKKLFRFCRIWSITSVVLPFLLIPLGSIFKVQTSEVYATQQVIFFFMTLCTFIWILGIIQIPFLIYANIINGMSRKKLMMNQVSK